MFLRFLYALLGANITIALLTIEKSGFGEDIQMSIFSTLCVVVAIVVREAE